MTTSTQDRLEQHRQTVRRMVILPVLGGLLLIALLVLSTAFLTPRQFTIVANLMMTCICLFPLVICLTPFYFGAVFAVWGMSRVNGIAYKQLENAQTLTANLAARTTQATDTLNRRAVDVGANAAKLDPLLDVFNREKPNDRT
jgi:uncharacterized membrane protein YdbT with pleckstrin-like domain